jgi:hypothetical protein
MILSNLIVRSDAHAAMHLAYLSKFSGVTIISEQIAREQKH